MDVNERLERAQAIGMTITSEDGRHQLSVPVVAVGRPGDSGQVHIDLCPVCNGQHWHLRRAGEGSILLRGLPCCGGENVYAVLVP